MTEPAPTYFTQCVSTRCVGGVFYHCVKELGHHFEPSDLCENPDIGQWSFTWITPPETRKTVAYIAGRMTGMKDWNFPAFHKAAAKLRDAGYEVINPAEEFGGATDLPRQVYMHKAMENVLRADVIFTLKGWDYSEGAALEVTVARAVGKEVKKLGRG